MFNFFGSKRVDRENPITAYFSPFGQGPRAKVSRPNEDSAQPMLRAREAPFIIDMTLHEDDDDDIPLAVQAAPQAAGAVHHAKSPRSAAGHIEHTNLLPTRQLELLEVPQDSARALFSSTPVFSSTPATAPLPSQSVPSCE
jgi:hypothetical protein